MESQLMQRLEGVDVDETRNKIENGSSAVETVRKAATSSTILGEKEKDASSILNNVVVRGPDGTPAARSASSENAGASREHQKRMGETAARGEAKEVEGGKMESVHRVVLPRDPAQIGSSGDLGVGVKVAGGVKCDKCGRLHTLITDVADDLPPLLQRGLAVVEWCGQCVDGVSYEVVRSVLNKTDQGSSVELVVKECRGPPPETKTENEPLAQDTPKTAESVSQASPPSSSERDASSFTPKSLSPSPSPVHSRTCTPGHSPSSASTPTPTPSPSPPPSPSANVHLRGAPRTVTSDPRPASINLPAFRPQGDVVKPRFMINDVPTSPPQITGPIKKYTIESFLGGAPSASVHLSLRYRVEDNHLRLLLHEVKHHQKNRGKPSTAHGRHYFINAYLLPDLDKQGVRSCEVLSHVSDLENPQFYTITKDQLMTVALRVVLWETKSKQQNFVGEVLLSLSDGDVVKLQGLPGWFPMCETDPNLPPLPLPVLAKKTTRKEDIFQRVRRGTGYALQSLRRPVSMGIEALAAEGSGGGGRISPSGSMENLESSLKKLRATHVTMPTRRVKKERRPLTGLFTSSQVPNITTTQQQQQQQNGRGSDGQNGVAPVENDRDSTDVFDADTRGEAALAKASLSVPSSPLLQRRAVSAGRERGRRKRLAGILNVLRGSLLPDLSNGGGGGRKRAAMEAVDGGGDTTNRRWSLSGDEKHRIIGPMVVSPPHSVTSSPFSSPLRTRMRHISPFPLKANLSQSNHRRANSDAGILDYDWTDSPSIPPQSRQARGERGSGESVGDRLVMDSLDTGNTTLQSDSSWHSAEEELRGQSRNRATPNVTPNGASRLLYSHPRSVDSNGGSDTRETMDAASKMKSKSADDLLDSLSQEARRDGASPRKNNNHPPLTRTRCAALSRESSGSSVEESNLSNSRPPSSTRTSSEEEPGGEGGGGGGGESSLDSSTCLKVIGRVNAMSPSPKVSLASTKSDVTADGCGGMAERPSISRWRSFDDILEALPKIRPKWLRRNKTHSHSPSSSSSAQQSPLLKRRSSEPAVATSPPIGKAKLELTYNPETSMIGVRLHEHTLSDAKTDLTVQTYLFARSGGDSDTGQRNVVSFKKTHYSHTLVASFHCKSKLTDSALQVSLETSGRFFGRLSGHVVLDLGPLVLSSPSLSCNQWFPLFHSPLSPPNNAHPN